MKTERRSKRRAKPSPPPSPDKIQINAIDYIHFALRVLPAKLGLVWFAIQVGTILELVA